MNKELTDYIQDSENDIANFNLAYWYESQRHLSPSCSYYLRCAELTKDEDLAYECLLRLYLCYYSLSNRDYTCENLLKSALKLKPQKPEAYFFLSQFFERKNNWMDGYLYASLALELLNCEPSKFKTSFEYNSQYMLLFQKAVCAWWYGKPKEARVLFRKLKEEYGNKLDDKYTYLVQKNLSTLGSGSSEESEVKYNKSNYELRFKFDGCDDVEHNFSQACQDLFVLAALNGKKNGTYLEIGAAHSYLNSNTALLEKHFDWTGVGVELKQDLADMHKMERKNKCINTDALKIDYEKLLDENFSSHIIDYLQLDIEPSKNTFEALLLIPFNKYKFRVITYEHDHYVDVAGEYREKSRRYLKNMGYTLVFNDIAPNEGSNFEDWWVHKELIDDSILQNLSSYPIEEINLVENLMLKKKVNKLKGFPRVNFVGIEESVERRENLIKQFSRYGIENLKPHLFKRYQEYNHKLTGRFIGDLHENSKGPTTSHIKTIKNWYDSTNEDYVFICEDDLSLEPVDYWDFTWEEFFNNLPQDWECVQLTWIRPDNKNIELRERLGDDWGAAAYLMKREYAKRIIDNYYINDNEFNLDIEGTNLIPIVENILFAGIGKVYNIPIFVEDVKNVKSTYFGKDLIEINGQGEYHWDSYYWIISWWKNKGQYIGIKNIIKKIPHIYQQSQFGEDWFTYPNLYKSVIQRFGEKAHFV
jgi:tRNA G46 methylase TrmB